jgi:hypothetical protein
MGIHVFVNRSVRFSTLTPTYGSWVPNAAQLVELARPHFHGMGMRAIAEAAGHS